MVGHTLIRKTFDVISEILSSADQDHESQQDRHSQLIMQSEGHILDLRFAELEPQPRRETVKRRD